MTTVSSPCQVLSLTVAAEVSVAVMRNALTQKGSFSPHSRSIFVVVSPPEQLCLRRSTRKKSRAQSAERLSFIPSPRAPALSHAPMTGTRSPFCCARAHRVRSVCSDLSTVWMEKYSFGSSQEFWLQEEAAGRRKESAFC